jgi:hypothetical protein
MSELKFFLLRGDLTQNSNTVELVKFLDKYQKFHIQIEVATLKVTSCRNMSKFFWTKVKIQDSVGKTNFFSSTLSLSPWAVLPTWLHVGTPQKIQEN